MKLLFVFYDRPDYFVGPIVNARRLLPELCSRGHEVHCLIFRLGAEGAPSADYLESLGVHCYVHPFDCSTEDKIVWILQQISYISPDVFVPNLSVAGWFAARWAREAGIPTIACHRSDEDFYWAMVDDFVLGDKLWAVSGLVCVSEHLKNAVSIQCPEYTKLCVIPSGVPIPAETSRHDGPLKIAYVGRMVQEQKRVHDLIDALALVMDSQPDITATLYGDGPERANVEKRIGSLGLSHRIHIAGVCPSEQIQDQLVQYHVLVLLSDYEGTPGAVMDAMACGVVPVCLDIEGGVRDLVIDKVTGVLVKNRRQDFLTAIKMLSDDPDLRKSLAANAKQHIMGKFSLQHAADLWEGFCKELLDSAPVRQPFIAPPKIRLPDVRKEFAREDFRQESFFSVLAKRLARFR